MNDVNVGDVVQITLDNGYQLQHGIAVVLGIFDNGSERFALTQKGPGCPLFWVLLEDCTPTEVEGLDA